MLLISLQCMLYSWVLSEHVRLRAQVCSGQLEYVANGSLGQDIVTHQLACAQSASDAFPIFKALGGDGEPFQRHCFAKALEHDDNLMREGARLSCLSTRPPVIWKFDKQGQVQTQILGVARTGHAKGTHLTGSPAPHDTYIYHCYPNHVMLCAWRCR